MNPLPNAFADVREIFFIADDATGPFTRVIQYVRTDGTIVTIEDKLGASAFVRWLSDRLPESAAQLDALLRDPDEQNIEMLIYRKGDWAGAGS